MISTTLNAHLLTTIALLTMGVHTLVHGAYRSRGPPAPTGPLVRPRPEAIVAYPRHIELFACEGDRLSLLCPANHKIQILIGLYAKNYTAAAQCKGKNGVMTFTYPPDHESICNETLTIAAFQHFLQRKCNDQFSCEFRVWTKDFDINPNMCHEYPRVAELAYRCMPMPTTTTTTTTTVESIDSIDDTSNKRTPSTVGVEQQDDMTTTVAPSGTSNLSTTTASTTTTAPLIVVGGGYPIRPSRYIEETSSENPSSAKEQRPIIRASDMSASSSRHRSDNMGARPSFVNALYEGSGKAEVAPVRYEESGGLKNSINTALSSTSDFVLGHPVILWILVFIMSASIVIVAIFLKLMAHQAALLRAKRAHLEKTNATLSTARPPHAPFYDDASFL